MIQCSVIVPAYNVSRYIRRCIDSILSQTLSNIEVIIVDDKSSDNTYEIVKEASRRDDRIRGIQHKENSGASRARNTALKVARGEWIAFVDADDWMEPGRLEHLIATGEKWMADMVADNIYIISYSSHRDIGKIENLQNANTLFSKKFKQTLPRFISPSEFIRGNMPGPRNPRLGLIKPVIRRTFLEKHSLRWREDVLVSQDMVFYLDCLMHGARCLLIPEAHYYYLEGRPDSISSSIDQIKANIDRYKINTRLIIEYKEDKNVKKALCKRERRLKKIIKYDIFNLYYKKIDKGVKIVDFDILFSFMSVGLEKMIVHLISRFKSLKYHLDYWISNKKRLRFSG